MRKRAVTALFTAVSMMLGTNILSVCAKEELPLVYTQCGYAAENDITQVSIVTDKSIDVSAFSIEIRFNPEEIVFVDGLAGDSTKNGTFYCNGSYSEDCVRVVWSGSRDTTVHGELANLTFKTMSGTGGTSVPVSVGYTMFGNENLEEIPVETMESEIEVMTDYVWGDVNLDGVISSADLVLVNKYNINSDEYPLGDSETVNADLDYNKVINTDDCGILLKEVTTAGKWRNEV